MIEEINDEGNKKFLFLAEITPVFIGLVCRLYV